MKFERITVVVFAVACLLGCAPPGQGSLGFRDVDWPRADQFMTPSDNREIEILLSQLGYLRGGLDGQIGRDTRTAIRAYQADIGAPVTGFVSEPLLFSLRVNAPIGASVPAEATSAPSAAAVRTTAAPQATTSATSGSSTPQRTRSSGGGGGRSSLGGGSGGAWN